MQQLTNQEWWCWNCLLLLELQHRKSQCSSKKTLQSRVRDIYESHLSCCGLKTRRTSWLNPHRCALSSTTPDQQQIATSSKTLQLPSNNCIVALQWILAHCGDWEQHTPNWTHTCINMVPWAACLWCKEDQTKEHILQNCEMRDKERSAAWSTETTLDQKLHGDDENLRRTTMCIAATGLTV